MKQSRLLSAISVCVLLGSASLALMLPVSTFTPVDILWFVVGLSVLKLSDVWLPRGDVVGMSSALALGALLLFDARVVLAILLVAECAALIPPGRERKWEMALAALAAEAAASVAGSGFLVVLGMHPRQSVLTTAGTVLRPTQYIYVLLAGILFATLEYLLLQGGMAMRDKRPLGATLLGSLSYGGWLIAAQASAGVLAALMYRTMSGWGLLVSVVMILVMRQSFVLLLDIRQAYDATIGVLLRAMEAQRPSREGVAERNATLCTLVGRQIGLHGRELERLRYAALLSSMNPPEPDCQSGAASQSRGTARIVEDVEFLSNVTPVLRLCEEPQKAVAVRKTDAVCAYVVLSVAARTSGVRREQVEGVRSRVGARTARDVDRAVNAVLEKAEQQVETMAG